jgi:putative DNA primase/helicase
VDTAGIRVLSPEKHAELMEYAPRPNRHGNHNGKPTEQPRTVEPIFVTMDTIKAEKVDWLWLNRIPLGRLVLLDGDPGAGKSYLSLAVASAVSRGKSLPGGEKPLSPSNVLLMSIEDGFGDTVRPRLDSMDADVSRIVIPNPKRGLAPSLMNAAFIEAIVKETGPALVVIDPIIAFTGKKDSDRASQVRELLMPLMVIAERYAFACIIIRHLNKQGNSKAMYRGSGSIDFMAACRGAFVVAEDPDERGKRILAHVKNTLGPKQPSLSFYIDGGFRWGEQVERDADELLQPSQSQGREKTQLEVAKRFLEDVLSGGPMPSNSVKEKATETRIAWRTVWRAKELLAVKASKERGTGEWFWRLG